MRKDKEKFSEYLNDEFVNILGALEDFYEWVPRGSHKAKLIKTIINKIKKLLEMYGR